jgi:hypothetical protein
VLLLVPGIGGKLVVRWNGGALSREPFHLEEILLEEI